MAKTRMTPVIFIFLGVFVAGIVFVQVRAFRGQTAPSPSLARRGDATQTRSLETTGGIKHIVPLDQLVSGGVLRDGVPAIEQPKFESVSIADQYLNNDGLGIAIVQNGAVKFYPYQILAWHHAVNDVASGVPILVSFSPLARAGAVFERTVGGSTIDFGVSDRMYNNDLLLYDRKSQSLFDPMLHEMIVGELAGTSLPLHAFSIMTWNDFKTAHADGKVLSRKTSTERDYTHNPYEDYESNDAILFPLSSKDDRLPSKELVIGVETSNGWKAYSVSQIEKMLIIRDAIGASTISVETDKTSSVIRVYLVDASGSHVKELPFIESYWFAWAAAYPGTGVFK